MSSPQSTYITILVHSVLPIFIVLSMPRPDLAFSGGFATWPSVEVLCWHLLEEIIIANLCPAMDHDFASSAQVSCRVLTALGED